MNSNSKKQFKSIDIDTESSQEVRFQSPFSYNAYSQLTPRKDLIKAWNEECRIREAELDELRKARKIK